MTLVEVQAIFWQAVRSPRPPSALREMVAAQGALGVVERMQIYRAAYWARHERCLQETYPRVLALIGNDAFRGLVADYIEHYPSTLPAIESAGRHFPRYLERISPPGYAGGALSDLAKLEWARVFAIIAPDGAIADASVLDARDVAGRSVRTASSLSLLQVRPCALRWLHDAEASNTSAPEGPVCWVAVWRSATRARELVLQAEEGRALSRALRGETLAFVCAEFAEPGALARAAGILSQWLSRGWIASLEGSHALPR